MFVCYTPVLDQENKPLVCGKFCLEEKSRRWHPKSENFKFRFCFFWNQSRRSSSNITQAHEIRSLSFFFSSIIINNLLLEAIVTKTC